MFTGFALLMTGGAIAAALAALTARSLLAVCLYLAAMGALVAAALLSLGAGEAALAAALGFVGWTPVLLLGGVLLSARAAKNFKRGAPWASIAAAALAGALVLVGAIDLGEAPIETDASLGASGLWLTMLLLAAGAACVGLIGFGERGALRRLEREP